MATPTLLARINLPGDIGDAALKSVMEVPSGGITGPFTISLPSGGTVDGPEIFYPLGIVGFGLQINVAAIGNIALDMIPVHPISLTEFSDLVNGQFRIPINLTIGAGLKYFAFGDPTNLNNMGLASMAFKLSFTDNVGGPMGYDVTYTLFGFSFLSRPGE